MTVPAASEVVTGLVDWAARTPERVAVHDRERALTFEEVAGLAGGIIARDRRRGSTRGIESLRWRRAAEDAHLLLS